MLPHNTPRPADAAQAQGLRRPGAPAPGAAAGAVRDHPGRAVGHGRPAYRPKETVAVTLTETTIEHDRRADAERHRRREGAAECTSEYTSESPSGHAACGRPPPARRDRPPQGGHRPRPHRARHRPVDDQRPRARGVLPEQGAPAARQRAVRDARARRAATTSSRASHGGGVSGQAGALRLGIARALNEIDIEAQPPGAEEGRLPDPRPRVKERKKYGLKKARKAPQYSKR